MKELDHANSDEQNHGKERARSKYQKTHGRTQNHGSRQSANGHFREHNPFFANRQLATQSENPAELMADDWTEDDKLQEDYRLFTYGQAEDVQGLDSGAAEAAATEHQHPYIKYYEGMSPDMLALELLGRLEKGELDKDEALFIYEGVAGPVDRVGQTYERILGPVGRAATVKEQEADEMRDMFRNTGRLASARTLDNKPLGETDYLDGFHIVSR